MEDILRSGTTEKPFKYLATMSQYKSRATLSSSESDSDQEDQVND